jgi:hypothetical protein
MCGLRVRQPPSCPGRQEAGVRAYERPCVAFDRDDWAHVIPSTSEPDRHLESVDVLAGEYRVYTLDGRVVEAIVVGGRVALRETDERDIGGFRDRLAALVRRYDLASSPDDPVAVANELLRRDWEAESSTGMRRLRRSRAGGPDIVQPPAADGRLIDLLRRRDGQRTLVELQDGRHLRVTNIAWGYDMGDEYAHVTTNASPQIEGEPMELFSTKEVRRVLDPEGHQVLWP